MTYVLNADLTDEYIQSLITRNGFSDVTAEVQNGYLYVIQDLNGNQLNIGSMQDARDWLVMQYLIIQNG